MYRVSHLLDLHQHEYKNWVAYVIHSLIEIYNKSFIQFEPL